ncbi:MAG: hypothetical protein AAF950_08535 [Pseudomonadota bacterium]
MKKLIALTAMFAVTAAPASAAKTTIEFVPDDGPTVVMTFDDETGMATDAEGNSMPFTYDEEAATICGQGPDGELCATFADTSQEPAVGVSSAYTTNIGSSGTATITAIEVPAAPSGS